MYPHGKNTGILHILHIYLPLSASSLSAVAIFVAMLRKKICAEAGRKTVVTS